MKPGEQVQFCQPHRNLLLVSLSQAATRSEAMARSCQPATMFLSWSSDMVDMASY